MAVEHLFQSDKIKIASWNVNSIRVRVEHVTSWIKQKNPDVLLLQELKAQEQYFPKEPFEDLGYNIVILGQKSYNGVAILSKFPISDIVYGLPNVKNDDQSRYLEAWINSGEKGLRVASIYVPNGNPVGTPKYSYKVDWLNSLIEHAYELNQQEEATILGGDFNICPNIVDLANPTKLKDDAVFMPEIRQLFRKLINIGYVDSFRALNPKNEEYTYWDYGNAFEHNNGLRIDHLLMSSIAIDRCTKVQIDTKPRTWVRPSDHTPIFCDLL